MAADISPPQSLDTIAGELVKHIISDVAQDPSSITRYTDSNLRGPTSRDNPLAAFREISVVCKSVGPWAQELLFHAPILRRSILRRPRSSSQYVPSIVSFARTLLDRPDLGCKVRKLTIVLPSRRVAKEEVTSMMERHPAEMALIIQKATRYIILSERLPSGLRRAWLKSLQGNSLLYALIGVILAHTPNLAHLGISADFWPVSDKPFDVLFDPFGLKPTNIVHNNHLLEAIHAGIVPPLKSVYVSDTAPVTLLGFDLLPNKPKLALEPLFCHGRAIRFSPTPGLFANVTNLSLSFGLRRHHSQMSGSKAEPTDYYGPLIASFPHLSHLSLHNSISNSSPKIRELMPVITNPSLLKTLNITNSHPLDSLSGCLGAFVALETLTLPLNLIWDLLFSEPSSLLTSLQHLIIEDALINTNGTVVMVASSKERQGVFRTLTKLDVYCPPKTYDRWDASEIEEMFESTARAGIAFTLTCLKNWEDRQSRFIPAEL